MKKFIKKKIPFNLLGPGFITGAADDDPSGIATYSQAGAEFGLKLLWLAPLTFPLMAIVQEMCARIGLVTGRGLASNIRKSFPFPVVLFLTSLLVVANIINIGADLGAMVAAILLLIPFANFLALLLVVTLVSAALQIFLPYHTYAKYLKWLAFVLVFYVFSAIAVKNINWSLVLENTIFPQISSDTLFVIVAILGTTISPYLFFWQTSQEVEEEIDHGVTSIKARRLSVTPRSLTAMRIDVWVGMFFSNAIMFFIILATAVTVYTSKGSISSASDAANALRPFVGDFSYLVFTLGIIGTGLLAVPVLAGSSAYAVCEVFKKKEGLSKKWYQAGLFYGVIIVSMVIGMVINLFGFNPIKILIWSAVLNGVVAPFILASIVTISNNKKVMGKYVNGKWTSRLGWGITIVMAIVALPIVFGILKSL